MGAATDHPVQTGDAIITITVLAEIGPTRSVGRLRPPRGGAVG